MKFGNKKLFLAPLAGISDIVFRSLCKTHGADVVVSEMVSVEGITRNSKNTPGLLVFSEKERPIGIQLFGADPARFGDAAGMVEELVHPDFIDLNSGCPVPKVIKRNGGAALLRNLDNFSAIVTAMVKSVKTPISVKIRSAWTAGEWVDIEFAKAAEACGAAAVILHPRTRAQMFSGKSDWQRIALVKQSVQIPVVGNGDVTSPESAKTMFDETGCDSIMIGRGALGNPWVFKQIHQFLDGKTGIIIGKDERYRTIIDHIDAYAHVHGKELAAKEMKKHISWYIHGLPGASAVRKSVVNSKTVDEQKTMVTEFFKSF